MGVKITNNASGTLAAAITSGATTLTLTSGQGALFPTLGVGDYCWCTLVDTSNNVEIIKVTARSTDTLTMTRGQDNTTAQAFAISDRLELRPTAALFAEFADPAMGGDLTGTASNAQIAANAVGLAEMAGGTDGNLITYDASGDPAYVTTGTSGQILTSGGAGVAPTFQAAAGGDNTPSFCAYLSADQNVSADTSVKIQFNTEVFDTNSAYDNSSNYRFTVPSGEAGKYVIMMDVHGDNSDTGATSMNGYIYKNGALFRQVNNHLTANSINRMHLPLNFIDDASVSDYYECYVNLSGSSTKVEGGTGTFGSTFMMFKLII